MSIHIRKLGAKLTVNGKDFQIFEGVNTIGRNKDAVVDLGNLSVSQHHAIITLVNQNQHFITDLKSCNGTFVNGKQLTPLELYELENGSTIDIATFHGTYYKHPHGSSEFQQNVTQNCTQSVYAQCTQIMEKSAQNVESVKDSSVRTATISLGESAAVSQNQKESIRSVFEKNDEKSNSVQVSTVIDLCQTTNNSNLCKFGENYAENSYSEAATENWVTSTESHREKNEIIEIENERLSQKLVPVCTTSQRSTVSLSGEEDVLDVDRETNIINDANTSPILGQKSNFIKTNQSRILCSPRTLTTNVATERFTPILDSVNFETSFDSDEPTAVQDIGAGKNEKILNSDINFDQNENSNREQKRTEINTTETHNISNSNICDQSTFSYLDFHEAETQLIPQNPSVDLHEAPTQIIGAHLNTSFDPHEVSTQVIYIKQSVISDKIEKSLVNTASASVPLDEGSHEAQTQLIFPNFDTSFDPHEASTQVIDINQSITSRNIEKSLVSRIRASASVSQYEGPHEASTQIIPDLDTSSDPHESSTQVINISQSITSCNTEKSIINQIRGSASVASVCEREKNERVHDVNHSNRNESPQYLHVISERKESDSSSSDHVAEWTIKHSANLCRNDESTTKLIEIDKEDLDSVNTNVESLHEGNTSIFTFAISNEINSNEEQMSNHQNETDFCNFNEHICDNSAELNEVTSQTPTKINTQMVSNKNRANPFNLNTDNNKFGFLKPNKVESYIHTNENQNNSSNSNKTEIIITTKIPSNSFDIHEELVQPKTNDSIDNFFVTGEPGIRTVTTENGDNSPNLHEAEAPERVGMGDDCLQSNEKENIVNQNEQIESMSLDDESTDCIQDSEVVQPLGKTRLRITDSCETEDNSDEESDNVKPLGMSKNVISSQCFEDSDSNDSMQSIDFVMMEKVGVSPVKDHHSVDKVVSETQSLISGRSDTDYYDCSIVDETTNNISSSVILECSDIIPCTQDVAQKSKKDVESEHSEESFKLGLTQMDESLKEEDSNIIILKEGNCNPIGNSEDEVLFKRPKDIGQKNKKSYSSKNDDIYFLPTQKDNQDDVVLHSNDTEEGELYFMPTQKLLINKESEIPPDVDEYPLCKNDNDFEHYQQITSPETNSKQNVETKNLSETTSNMELAREAVEKRNSTDDNAEQQNISKENSEIVTSKQSGIKENLEKNENEIIIDVTNGSDSLLEQKTESVQIKDVEPNKQSLRVSGRTKKLKTNIQVQLFQSQNDVIPKSSDINSNKYSNVEEEMEKMFLSQNPPSEDETTKKTTEQPASSMTTECNTELDIVTPSSRCLRKHKNIPVKTDVKTSSKTSSSSVADLEPNKSSKRRKLSEESTPIVQPSKETKKRKVTKKFESVAESVDDEDFEPSNSKRKTTRVCNSKSKIREEPSVQLEENPGLSSSDILHSPSRVKRKLRPKVVFTMIQDPKLESSLKLLGGTVVDSIESATVLVTGAVKRTIKLMSAVGLSKPICSTHWIEESKKKNEFLDPYDFILVDREAETKWDFSLRTSLERSSKTKLFQGYKFLLNTTEALEVLKAAIESCAGKVVNRCSKDTSNMVIVAGSGKRKKPLNKVNRSDILTVEPEAVLDAVLRQEIRFDMFLAS